MPQPDRHGRDHPGYERPVLPWEREPERAGAGRWAGAGIEFGLAVVLFFLGGRWLDGHLGTEPWLGVVGALLGVAVGTYLLVRPLFHGQRAPSPRAPRTDQDVAGPEADERGGPGE
jgi:hypothetical protein